MFTQLLSQEMTRREFLLYLGTLLVGVFGISNFVNLITKPTQKNTVGFGSGPYGGRTKLT